MNGYGVVVDHSLLAVSALNEEHGHIDCSRAPDSLAVGDRIRIVPNHACVVSNMVDQVYLMDGDEVFSVEDVAARGMVV